MTESFYTLLILDDGVRIQTFGSTSLPAVIDETQKSIRDHLDRTGFKHEHLKELATDDGFATIQKFHLDCHAEGETIWTYAFDGEELFEDAIKPIQESFNQQKEDKKYDVDKSINNQQSFCIAQGIPNFAPIDGNCYSCKRNIYLLQVNRGISTIKAASEHITGCPHCFKTFLD
jgi:hypothetical protein